MKPMKIQGEIIPEYSDHSNDIQDDIEQLLALVAAAHKFNWKEPLHDLVRSIMNSIYEFRPLDDNSL